MKYLAILGYDCGCNIEAGYGFIKPIRFHADNETELNNKAELLKQRKSRASDGFQCRRNIPIEVLVFDEEQNLVLKFNRRSS
ncbi:hypothetical protein J4218_01920 [Candidatus Pacearchaeota archaeon]|nr:hypothetical protein [uncultured archaeon]MBS3078854.1 hypothetical protein [Candidatus Pacearchaeota archaeon]